jgi:hypothetical protein
VGLLLSGVVWGAGLNLGQEQVLDRFCTDLKAQNYEAAFPLLSEKLQAQFSAGQQNHQQFVEIMKTFDNISGKVSDCHLAETIHNPVVLPWVSTGERFYLIQRNLQTQGRVALVRDESQTWRINELDPSFLSINLGVVARVVSYCGALEDLNFGSAFHAQTSSLGSEDPSGFTQAEIDHEQVDGLVTDCKVSGLPPNVKQTSTDAHVILDLKRANLNESLSGQVDLKQIQGQWMIGQIDSHLQGTDIGPLQLGETLCSDLAKAPSGLADAYSLLSGDYQAHLSEAQFAALFPKTYYGCLHDFSTYSVTPAHAFLNLGVKVQTGGPAPTPTLNIALEMTQRQDGRWQISHLSTS